MSCVLSEPAGRHSGGRERGALRQPLLMEVVRLESGQGKSREFKWSHEEVPGPHVTHFCCIYAHPSATHVWPLGHSP